MKARLAEAIAAAIFAPVVVLAPAVLLGGAELSSPVAIVISSLIAIMGFLAAYAGQSDGYDDRRR